MTELSSFHANGISFPDSPRPDVDQLVDRIPTSGTLHLAILRQPYLNLINDGTKTIESRFNTKRAAPFGRVAVGDLVLLKESGRPVANYFFADAANSFRVSSENIDEVRREYGPGICAQDEEEFWREKASSVYCTVVGIGERGLIQDLAVTKKDQRGWVTFSRTDDQPMTLF
jgi:hypothetical protein